MKFQMETIIVYPLLCVLHYIPPFIQCYVCYVVYLTIYQVLRVLYYVSHNLSSVVYYVMYLISGTDCYWNHNTRYVWCMYVFKYQNFSVSVPVNKTCHVIW